MSVRMLGLKIKYSTIGTVFTDIYLGLRFWLSESIKKSWNNRPSITLSRPVHSRSRMRVYDSQASSCGYRERFRFPVELATVSSPCLLLRHVAVCVRCHAKYSPRLRTV